MLSNVQKIITQFTRQQFSFQQPNYQPQLLFASPQWQAIPANSSANVCNINVATTRVSLPRKAKENGLKKININQTLGDVLRTTTSKLICKCGNNAASVCPQKSCARCCQDPKCPRGRHRKGLNKLQLAQLATADYLSRNLPVAPSTPSTPSTPSAQTVAHHYTSYCVTTTTTPSTPGTSSTPSRVPVRDIITYHAPKAKPDIIVYKAPSSNVHEPKLTPRPGFSYVLPRKASLTSSPATNDLTRGWEPGSAYHRLLEKEKGIQKEEKEARIRSMFYVRFPLRHKSKQKDLEDIFRPYCRLNLIEWIDKRSAYVTISDDATFGTYDTIYLNLVITSDIENEEKTYISTYSEVLEKLESENENKKRKRSEEEETEVNKKRCSVDNTSGKKKSEEEAANNTTGRNKIAEDDEQENIWKELSI